ncbi:MAG TPA: M67 family metallopeptidase, partial [Ardenticatenaceae bacterium]|nr:M67 family metallopeptidase [Ardenticatenaceae bacterium]
VRLPRVHYEAMVAHAREGKPEEVCGLVGGDQGGAITGTLPVVNAAPNKIVTYLMEPQSQLHAFMELDARGWELYGIYHSHPATTPYPSLTDQGKAFDPDNGLPLYPDCVYFILGLADPASPIIRAYLLPTTQSIEELPVEIV